jgi:RNA-directed DNA polymerase
VCKIETLRAAYDIAKRNDGEPRIDGGTFEAIEESGLEDFIISIQKELLS